MIRSWILWLWLLLPVAGLFSAERRQQQQQPRRKIEKGEISEWPKSANDVLKIDVLFNNMHLQNIFFLRSSLALCPKWWMIIGKCRMQKMKKRKSHSPQVLLPRNGEQYAAVWTCVARTAWRSFKRTELHKKKCTWHEGNHYFYPLGFDKLKYWMEKYGRCTAYRRTSAQILFCAGTLESNDLPSPRNHSFFAFSIPWQHPQIIPISSMILRLYPGSDSYFGLSAHSVQAVDHKCCHTTPGICVCTPVVSTFN